jgi:hypothetical protein
MLLAIVLSIGLYKIKLPVLYIMITCYITYCIGDLLSTTYVLKRGGIETNPIARRIFDKFGVLKGGFIFKNIILIPIIVGIMYVDTNSPYIIKYLLPSFIICLGSILVINNLIIGIKEKHEKI